MFVPMTPLIVEVPEPAPELVIVPGAIHGPGRDSTCSRCVQCQVSRSPNRAADGQKTRRRPDRAGGAECHRPRVRAGRGAAIDQRADARAGAIDGERVRVRHRKVHIQHRAAGDGNGGCIGAQCCRRFPLSACRR